MAFFQNSVLNKHLKTLDNEVVKTAYTKFTKYFHNPEIQQNIRNAKEAGGEKTKKTDEMEWMEVFETKKAEAQT